MSSPAATRYDSPDFCRRCGCSGDKLPLISPGLWHNFGAKASFENARVIACRAFDLGITRFDLANRLNPLPTWRSIQKRAAWKKCLTRLTSISRKLTIGQATEP